MTNRVSQRPAGGTGHKLGHQAWQMNSLAMTATRTSFIQPQLLLTCYLWLNLPLAPTDGQKRVQSRSLTEKRLEPTLSCSERASFWQKERHEVWGATDWNTHTSDWFNVSCQITGALLAESPHLCTWRENTHTHTQHVYKSSRSRSVHLDLPHPSASSQFLTPRPECEPGEDKQVKKKNDGESRSVRFRHLIPVTLSHRAYSERTWFIHLTFLFSCFVVSSLGTRFCTFLVPFQSLFIYAGFEVSCRQLFDDTCRFYELTMSKIPKIRL